MRRRRPRPACAPSPSPRCSACSPHSAIPIVLLAATALGVITFTALSYHQVARRRSRPHHRDRAARNLRHGVLAASQPVLAAAAGVIIVVLLVLAQRAARLRAARALRPGTARCRVAGGRRDSRAADTAGRSHRSLARGQSAPGLEAHGAHHAGGRRRLRGAAAGRRACRTADLRLVRRLRVEHGGGGHHGQACARAIPRCCRRRSPVRRCRMSPPSCSSRWCWR